MNKHFFIGKHKCVEFELGICSKLHSFFDINISLSRKQDHAGFYCYLSLFKLKFEFNICDHRHWDRTLNKWVDVPEPERDEEWEDYLGI